MKLLTIFLIISMIGCAAEKKKSKTDDILKKAALMDDQVGQETNWLLDNVLKRVKTRIEEAMKSDTTKIAVFPVIHESGATTSLSGYLQDNLINSLSASFQPLTKNELKNLVSEQTLNLSSVYAGMEKDKLKTNLRADLVLIGLYSDPTDLLPLHLKLYDIGSGDELMSIEEQVKVDEAISQQLQ